MKLISIPGRRSEVAAAAGGKPEINGLYKDRVLPNSRFLINPAQTSVWWVEDYSVCPFQNF